MWASLPDDGVVVRLGAAADRERRFAVGGHPGAIAASSDGLWVAGSGFAPLARFNLRTGSLESTAHVSSAPSLVAVDPDDHTVWAVAANGGITHLSPSGAVLGTPPAFATLPRAVTAGEGHWLWAVGGSLVRVGGSTMSFSVGPSPVAVTLDQGVWTAHANGHVTRFNPIPKFLSVNTNVSVAPSLDGISAVENAPAVWAISKQAKTLYRLSTAAGAPTTGHATFSSAPVALAATDGGVWVATADGTVVEVSG